MLSGDRNRSVSGMFYDTTYCKTFLSENLNLIKVFRLYNRVVFTITQLQKKFIANVTHLYLYPFPSPALF